MTCAVCGRSRDAHPRWDAKRSRWIGRCEACLRRSGALQHRPICRWECPMCADEYNRLFSRVKGLWKLNPAAVATA